MTLPVWQTALTRLRCHSWAAGCEPTARQWIDLFFAAAPPPLPLHVRRLIAESFVDTARLVRLRQLMDSPLGLRQKRPEGELPLPADVAGAFVAGSEELEALLSMWCASHELPRSADAVVHWLREAIAQVRFFTLSRIAQSSLQHGELDSTGRMYLTKAESVRALHTAFCALMTQSSPSGENSILDREVSLLALCLLRKCGALATSPCMLRNTAKLLATRRAAQPWLLFVPVYAQECADSRAVTSSPLFALQESSPLCQTACEVIGSTLCHSLEVANVEVPFVEPPHARDLVKARALSGELSRIASGT